MRKTPERQPSNVPADTPLPDSPAASPLPDCKFVSPPNLTPQIPDTHAHIYFQTRTGLAEIGFDRDPRSSVDDQHLPQPLPSLSRFHDRESQHVGTGTLPFAIICYNTTK